MNFGVGLGVRYHLTNNAHLLLQSEYVTVNSSGLDGYSFGRGRDNSVQTRIGFRYTLGKENHRDRSAAWQGTITREELSDLQANVQNSVERVDKSIGDVAGKADKLNQKVQDVIGDMKRLSEETKAKMDKLEAARSEPEKMMPALPESRNVYFDLGSARIQREQEPNLNEIVSILMSNQALKISLSPFTDPSGLAILNVGLRSRRENAVKNYLVSKGIDVMRIMSSPWPGTHSGINEKDRRVFCSFLY